MIYKDLARSDPRRDVDLGWTGDVYVMNADGSGKVNLTNSQNTYGAVFSPDGQKIAFIRKTGAQIDLYTIPVAGGAATRLTTGRSIYGIPAWSADGTKLSFSSNQDIYTINADGTGQTNVTNNASANNTFPGWGTGTTPVVASIYYIYPDHLNTPRAITNEAATTVWKWENADPFGNNAANEDPDGNSQAFVFNLRFPGQYADRETNTHYNMMRDYDPSIGRYVQSDPIGLGGGINTYAYVGGNPLSNVDPFGLKTVPDPPKKWPPNPIEDEAKRGKFRFCVDSTSSLSARVFCCGNPAGRTLLDRLADQQGGSNCIQKCNDKYLVTMACGPSSTGTSQWLQ